MILIVRCLIVLWGLMVIAAMVVALAAPSLIQLPEPGTEIAQIVAFAIILTFFFLVFSFIDGMKTMRPRMLLKLYAATLMAATVLFMSNPANRDLFMDHTLLSITNMIIISIFGWCALLAVLASGQIRSVELAS